MLCPRLKDVKMRRFHGFSLIQFCRIDGSIAGIYDGAGVNREGWRFSAVFLELFELRVNGFIEEII